MTARSFPWKAGLLLAVTATAGAAPVPSGDPATAFKPTLTLRIQPPDQLLSDVRYVAGLMARFAPTEKEAKEFAAATDESIRRTLGPDWRDGVDGGRPLLAYLTLEGNVPATTGTVLVPVKDEAAFRKMLTALVGKVEDDMGTLRFALPGARSADGN